MTPREKLEAGARAISKDGTITFYLHQGQVFGLTKRHAFPSSRNPDIAHNWSKMKWDWSEAVNKSIQEVLDD